MEGISPIRARRARQKTSTRKRRHPSTSSSLPTGRPFTCSRVRCRSQPCTPIRPRPQPRIFVYCLACAALDTQVGWANLQLETAAACRADGVSSPLSSALGRVGVVEEREEIVVDTIAPECKGGSFNAKNESIGDGVCLVVPSLTPPLPCIDAVVDGYAIAYVWRRVALVRQEFLEPSPSSTAQSPPKASSSASISFPRIWSRQVVADVVRVGVYVGQCEEECKSGLVSFAKLG
jgi:hypothetical protein